MREKILAHPIRWLIGLCACLVFFGCFGFPIYNFTTGRRFGSWYLLLALCFFYYEIGQILGVLHSRCKVRRSAALPVLDGVWRGVQYRRLYAPQCGAPPLCCRGAYHPGVPVPCRGQPAAAPEKWLSFPGAPVHQLLKKAISCPSF